MGYSRFFLSLYIKLDVTKTAMSMCEKSLDASESEEKKLLTDWKRQEKMDGTQ